MAERASVVLSLLLLVLLTLPFWPIRLDVRVSIDGRGAGVDAAVLGPWSRRLRLWRRRGGVGGQRGAEPHRGRFAALRGAIVLARALRGRVSCERLEVGVRLGADDAASTAVLVGVVWGGWGSLLPLLDREFPGARRVARLWVEPDFHHPGLTLWAAGIVRVRAGQIIFAALALRRGAARKGRGGRRQGGIARWWTIPSRA